MKLKTVVINHFKHIIDSTPVDIEKDVTCLVGKNESGKSAFLEALRRLKPANGNAKFDVANHYPAWLEKRHKREGKNIKDSRPIRASFELEEDDIKAVEVVFGSGVITSNEFDVGRTYKNNYSCVSLSHSEAKAVKNSLSEIELMPDLAVSLNECSTFDNMRKEIEKLKVTHVEDQEQLDNLEEVCEQLDQIIPSKKTYWSTIFSILESRMPAFFYYADYSTLPSIIKIKELLEADPEDLDDDDDTALALLKLAGTDNEYLLDPDYQTRKRELENVANDITQEILNYWSTNQDLRVLFDITQQTENIPNGQSTVVDELHIRMYDNKHMLSLPFDERSSGFRWFFSFLSAFSKYEFDNTPVVILLDEPALGLHAKAQKDFLKFIDERLSKKCQVIYSTHSPFMVQPNKLERARLVEDKGRDIGSVITSDVLTTDADTLFPLQSALGYDIAQHLFISKDNLVVEGPSDLIFMDAISQHLNSLGRVGLDPRWSIMPLGGADIIPAFVALLGHHLDVTVVVDSRKEGHQKLTALAKNGFLADTRIITIGEFTDTKMADIEDLFSVMDYLRLYNKAFKKKLKKADLNGSDPIVRQLARLEKVDRFNHDAPADALLRDRVGQLSKLNDKTLSNFEKLFTRINNTLA